MVSEEGKGRRELATILTQQQQSTERFGRLKGLKKYFKRGGEEIKPEQ